MSNGIRIATAAACLLATIALACNREDGPAPLALSAASQPPPESRDARLMRRVAADYAKWGRADEHAQWAPAMCAPSALFTGARGDAVGKISQVDSPETAHVRKLFLLYAQDKQAYLAVTDATEGRAPGFGAHTQPTTRPATAPAECAQIVVKEAWAPVEITAEVARRTPADRKARKGDKWYKAGPQADLFVMARLADEKAAGTDQGWIYGVVTPSTPAVVKEVGLLRQCADCHHQAGPGRLYGVRRGE